MTQPRWQVPPTWQWVSFGEISTVVGGGTPPTSDESNFDSNGIPWITPADLTGYKSSHISKGRRSLSQKGFDASSARLLPPGSVLFSSRAPIGYCVVAANEICTNQGFKSFVLQGGISAEYTRYYLLASVDYAESLSSGTTFKELSGSKAGEMSYPLAPLAEQGRIAAKIDNLNDKSKRTRNHINYIIGLIEKYKQAILVAAFNGALTKLWRKENGLVEKWVFTDFKNFLHDVRYGTSKKSEYTNGKYPVLRIPNIQLGHVNLNDLKYADFNENEVENLKLNNGDILIIRSNGSLDLVGRSAVVTSEAEGMIFAGYLIRLRLNIEQVCPEFINLFLMSESARQQIRKFSKSTSGVNNINGSQLKNLTISLPSIREQKEIVRRIESAFGWIDRLATEANNAYKLIDRLDQSILSKAFRGRLIPQDINDEPVEALLGRIVAERQFQKEQPKQKVKRVKREGNTMTKKLAEVLFEATDWLVAQEAFRLCGVGRNATTEDIEPIYAELRALDQSGQLSLESIRDAEGKKLYDRIRLNRQADHAS